MADSNEPKKFSFGFSKIAKKPALITPKQSENNGVEYIKSVEDNTVKLVNEEAAKPKALPVIPMPLGTSIKDRILEAIKARTANSKAQGGKKEESKPSENGIEAKPLTLDEMAAKELLENAQMETEAKTADAVIPSAAENSANTKQSTLDDYESMPIGDFGLAMLRGMGWEPAKGIGLNQKVVDTLTPQLRPKGMGLGADKALKQSEGSKSGEELVMKKGSMIKVINGPHSHLYGKIDGFEDLPGRILVRLALSNDVVSMSEFMVQLVGPGEFNKNSKVMNIKEYSAAVESKPTTETADRPRFKSEQKTSSRDNDSKYSRDKDRSRSPKYSHKSDHKSKRRDDSRERTSKKDRYRSDSDSRDRRSRRKSQDRGSRKNSPYRHKKSKKYESESSSDSDYRDEKRDKSHGKHKAYSKRSESDSSENKYSRKHYKSRK